MNIEEEIFSKYKVDYNKLIKYGFIKEDNIYKYSKLIMNNKFRVDIIYDNKINGSIYDINLEEEYTNFRVKDMIGDFVSSIREEYKNILISIRDNCFTREYFICKQANRIAKEIIKIYNDEPEFLWEDNNAVFRNKDSNKWYAAILEVNKNKIIGNEEELVNVLDIKLDSDIVKEIIDNKYYFEGYHMNKKNWISIILDDSLKDETIIDLIKKSHKLFEIVNEWIIPSSGDYGFDIVDYFNKNGEILWHQNIKVNVGDIVYIYAGKPYSAILYKSVVSKKDIPNPYKGAYSKYKNVMKLKIVDKYDENLFTLNVLKECGVTSVRGQRRITNDLSKLIKKYDKDLQ